MSETLPPPPSNAKDVPPVTGSPRLVDGSAEKSESTVTVIVAFAANLVIAAAKSAAAALTGSASMTAEAVHSWADTGNEAFLLLADRRSKRAADRSHPLGYGREVYVWSMFAAIGLFAVGAGVSVTHGIQELVHPEPASDFAIAYIVLAISFLLEGASFLRSISQARREARDGQVFEHILGTSDPTLRAVFAEDAAAIIGLFVAFGGVLAHQLTGSPIPDAIGSIVVGLVLGVISIVLIDRNRRFLVGEEANPQLRKAILARIADFPEVAKVTYLRMEYVGPRALYLVASVDLQGDRAESSVARTLDELERRATTIPVVAGAVFTVSTPEEPALT